jgi:hypothetical protein
MKIQPKFEPEEDPGQERVREVPIREERRLSLRRDT